jgi:hypothetical protein
VTTRRWAAIVSLALLAATLAPLVRDPAHDSVPLSTYPMFAAPRPARPSLSYAVGATATGERRELPTRAYGTGEVVQAAAIVDRAVAGGVHGAIALCEQIAARVAADADEPDDIATIRIVTGTYDDTTRRSEVEEARCAVRR